MNLLKKTQACLSKKHRTKIRSYIELLTDSEVLELSDIFRRNKNSYNLDYYIKYDYSVSIDPEALDDYVYIEELDIYLEDDILLRDRVREETKLYESYILNKKILRIEVENSGSSYIVTTLASMSVREEIEILKDIFEDILSHGFSLVVHEAKYEEMIPPFYNSQYLKVKHRRVEFNF